MKLNPLGRAALLACATLVLGLGISSCATSTLGYLFVTSTQYGEVASLRLDINSGAIKGVSCNTHNGSQQNCNIGAGGTNPTKLISAQNNSILYVLNVVGNGVIQGNISVFSLGPSGGVYSTGQSFVSSGQNPIDMYMNPSGSFLYVLDQYQPASVAGCANPTPTTCPGDITVFAIGNNGNLTVVQNQSPLQGQTVPTYFAVGYIPDPVILQTNNVPMPNLPNGLIGSHMLVSGNTLYVLDQSAPGATNSEINAFQVVATGTQAGQLLASSATPPTAAPYLESPTAIVAGGGDIFISDSETGQIWTYKPGSNGALAAAGSGVVCPAELSGSTTCLANSLASVPNIPVALSALIVDPSGQYLYAADYNNGTVFSMLILTTAATGNVLQQTSDGGNYVLGSQATCLTVSTGTEFLYASGNGNVSGVQIDTNSGNTTANDHPTTQASFTGAVPCLVFTPRT